MTRKLLLTLGGLACAFILALTSNWAAAGGEIPAQGQIPTPKQGWDAEYWAHPSHSGAPILQRFEPKQEIAIDQTWMLQSPASGVPVDNFSSRWSRTIDVVRDGATANITLMGDDEIRVLVDGVEQLKVTTPWEQATVSVSLAKGWHRVVVEHREFGVNAVARMSLGINYNDLPGPGVGWQAEYWANASHAGEPTLQRYEQELTDHIFHDWYLQSPGAGIPADYFSSRWTRSVDVKEDTTVYLSLYGDDELRVLIDGVERLKTTQVWQQFDVRIPISRGKHTFVVEHVEREVNAIVRFSMGFQYDEPPLPPPPDPMDDPEIVSFSAESSTGTQIQTQTLSYQLRNAEEAFIRITHPNKNIGEIFKRLAIADDGSGTFLVKGYDFCEAGKVEYALVAYSGQGQQAESKLWIDWSLVDDIDWFFASGDSAEPCSPPVLSGAAQQKFEHGYMVWIAERDTIYVFVDETSQQKFATRFEDFYDPAVDPNGDSSITPPTGLRQPTGGIGKIWRETPFVREALGWAVEPERGYRSTWQWARSRVDQFDPIYSHVEYFSSVDGGLFQLNGVWSGPDEVGYESWTLWPGYQPK